MSTHTPTPVLATKLYIPLPPPKSVFRPRLIERLNAGLNHNHKLTLVSAPAGFGKTTLVTAWLTSHDRPVTWLSLDEGDSEPGRFLTYLVAALQKIKPNLGAGLIEVLQSPQPPSNEIILSALLNETTAIPGNFFLVLDDYHLIESRPVDKVLTFLLEHLPPQMHLVITTREDPQVPLPRLRARGQLTELRANDLRFTAAEAAEFLKEVMSLSLTQEDLATLEDRTEGWIAGLQLAALSMQGHHDMAGFVRSFAGDHRYILDYLVEEVLRRQSEDGRNFLLQTSILNRLNASLCEAVTGQAQGQVRLEALERGNFFIVPLDDKRQWYRYHHLFADVLYAYLKTEQPEKVSTLHRRASEWYEHNGAAADAIRHALAARDFERTASLIELCVPAMRRSRQETVVLGWLKALPDDVIRCRPVLSLQYADTLMLTGKLEGVDARLRDAEQGLDSMAQLNVDVHLHVSPAVTSPEQDRKLVVVNKEEYRRLPGAIAINRAGLALVQGDVPTTIKYAQRALDLLPEEDHLGRGAAASLLGLSYWTNGDLEAGYHSYAEGRARLQLAGHLADTMGCTIALADIRITQGRLHDAMTTYELALQLATRQGMDVLRGTADMYVGMSELYFEHNDLIGATQYLHRSRELSEIASLPQYPYRWRVAFARIKLAEGDGAGALELLHEAEQVYTGDFFPNVRPIAAMKARLWVRQGRLGLALDWVRERGLSVEDDLSYLREYEHISFARVLLAQAQNNRWQNRNRADFYTNEVFRLLKGLLQAAQEGGRKGSLIEILVLLSLAHQSQGDLPSALAALQQALTLAEPEGYVRIFVDEEPAMAHLLQEALKHQIVPNYTRQLLAASGKVEEIKPFKQPLVEPLTERELELLRLLRTNLTGPEIARTLLVSLSTIRTHTQNVYTKLEVNDRRAAVNRGEELGLL
ncbi:MAG: helix-turn-helix transcriptional regulator [Chloroflexi bacterium]|nr:helix-turn-helix transcriptional regulator [Chloroflexota bacterium]OJV92129.1 MAG: helix-turn-helix transcriptional regulator [Chloroflexi bacterium 54-19]